MLGWFRDANCEPPDWNTQPVISGQEITISVPGSAIDWRVDFYDTETGITSTVSIRRQGINISLTLPDFSDDIAFKMVAQD
jgi:hypothetical protein